MDKNNAIMVIEKLTEICKDGEKGYKDAAEHTKRSDLKTFFATQSSERGRFARELQAVLMNLGKWEKKGVWHRRGHTAPSMDRHEGRPWCRRQEHSRVRRKGRGRSQRRLPGSDRFPPALRRGRYSEPTGPQCSSRPRPGEESTGRVGRIDHTWIITITPEVFPPAFS